jgi:RND family efflux transporter MFP subunit
MNLGIALRTLALAGGLLLAVGCGKKQASLPPPPIATVEVAHPLIQPVTDFEFFTGRTEASESVDIRSRVTGYLLKAPFKEGEDIQEGKLLFQIDPATYEAEVERAEASIKQNEALLTRLDSDYQRARTLMAGRAASREELDKITGDRAQANANLKAATAALRLAKVNLAYTRIAAPLSGRLSRRMVDPGNLVKADDTILTTLVRLDPMYAYFDVDERTVLKLRRLLAEGKITSARKKRLDVNLSVADEEKYTRTGYIDFVDNRLDPGTGTLRIRVVIDNKDHFLSPGMFIRLRLPVGVEHPALLVPEEALASDLAKKFLFVVRTVEEQVRTEDDSAKTRQVRKAFRVEVKLGQLQENNWRVIEEVLGKEKLTPSDEVIVKGLQSVRAGDEVTLAP